MSLMISASATGWDVRIRPVLHLLYALAFPAREIAQFADFKASETSQRLV
jgi:hypothetical protein